MRQAVLVSISALVLASGFTACGDDDDPQPASDESPAGRTSATAPPATGAEGDQAEVNKGTPLKREIYPRCGVSAYASPAVAPVPRFGGFQLIYTHLHAENPSLSTGKTTRFSLEERPSDSTRVTYKNGRVARIRGLKVDLVKVSGGFTAQWVTSRARYVIVGGPVDDGIVKKLVRCLP